MKSLVAVYSLCLAAGLITVRADNSNTAEASKSTGTAHKTASAEHKPAAQKTARKELMAKYDANKDGKLDSDERAKISAEDKAKIKKVAKAHPQKATAHKTHESSQTATATPQPAAEK